MLNGFGAGRAVCALVDLEEDGVLVDWVDEDVLVDGYEDDVIPDWIDSDVGMDEGDDGVVRTCTWDDDNIPVD